MNITIDITENEFVLFFIILMKKLNGKVKHAVCTHDGVIGDQKFGYTNVSKLILI